MTADKLNAILAIGDRLVLWLLVLGLCAALVYVDVLAQRDTHLLPAPCGVEKIK